ncbi:MAG: hypothetical protein PWP03_289 [Candidatus Woesearchaeota archaeon]|nr:hypothetical protein [Candidatus Woesearchaeota archaeon]MDN5327651.1 hypothetical protein [Candidatus Woesearchaeota archaeon]
MLFKKGAAKTKSASSKLPDVDNLFKEIKPEHFFLVKDGIVLKSLLELVDALEFMDDETFRYHVNDLRNDFYNWIKDVFNEDELAVRVLSANDKHEMQVVLLREMVRRLLPLYEKKKARKKSTSKKTKQKSKTA